MNLIQTIVLGIVEGLGEFLPISSTFHLILASKIMGIGETEMVKLFQVFIQSGAILAVLVLFWRDFLNKNIWKNLILSFVPTALMGFVLHGFIKNTLFDAFWLQIVVFFVVGLIFLSVDESKEQTTKRLNYPDAIIIGIAQTAAILPGVSRAGAVMVCMLLLGYGRKESAKYSFLLAVPTILAAGIWDVYKNKSLLIGGEMLPYLAVGSLVAFVVAMFLVTWFMNFNRRYGLKPWGWYRMVLATVCVLIGLR